MYSCSNDMPLTTDGLCNDKAGLKVKVEVTLVGSLITKLQPLAQLLLAQKSERGQRWILNFSCS